MGSPIDDPMANQCGNCKFWDVIQNHPQRAGECLGVPPTPCIIGAQPAKFGQGVQYHTEMMRPMMAANARPCSLHQRTLVMDLKTLGPTSKLSS